MEIQLGELYQLIGERDAEIYVLKRELARQEMARREAAYSPELPPGVAEKLAEPLDVQIARELRESRSRMEAERRAAEEAADEAVADEDAAPTA